MADVCHKEVTAAKVDSCQQNESATYRVLTKQQDISSLQSVPVQGFRRPRRDTMDERELAYTELVRNEVSVFSQHVMKTTQDPTSIGYRQGAKMVLSIDTGTTSS